MMSVSFTYCGEGEMLGGVGLHDRLLRLELWMYVVTEIQSLFV